VGAAAAVAAAAATAAVNRNLSINMFFCNKEIFYYFFDNNM
jgi:hypothetical protein